MYKIIGFREQKTGKKVICVSSQFAADMFAYHDLGRKKSPR